MSKLIRRVFRITVAVFLAVISDITGRPITDRKSHDAAKADAQARKAEAPGAAKPE